MKIIEIKTQSEFDNLPDLSEPTYINVTGKLNQINKQIPNSIIRISGSAVVEYVCGSAVVDSGR